MADGKFHGTYVHVLGNIKKGVIIMMLYELLARTDKNVPVKCMIRNEKSVTTVQGSCDFVYNKLNRNGLASNVLYIDIDDDTMIVRAE
jgi:RNase adaptor protein for sRNA GlmZ degradation